MIKDKLFTQTALKIGLLIQKHIFDTENLKKHLKDYLLLGRLYYKHEKGIQFLESVLRYLSYASDITYNDLEKSTRFLPEQGREIFMTLAEQLIEKGEIIEKQNVLIKLISRKFGISNSDEMIIKKTESPEPLDTALDIILFAESKSEVISVLKKQS